MVVIGSICDQCYLNNRVLIEFHLNYDDDWLGMVVDQQKFNKIVEW